MSELYGSLSDLAYAMSGARAHTRLRLMAELSVDRASLALLRVLAAAPDAMRMGELAQALMVQPPHVTREIKSLEQRGLVETVHEASDHRVRRITITDDGRELVARAEAIGQHWLGEALSGFTADELNITARVIRGVNVAYRRD